jgi:hypothetical protein
MWARRRRRRRWVAAALVVAVVGVGYGLSGVRAADPPPAVLDARDEDASSASDEAASRPREPVEPPDAGEVAGEPEVTVPATPPLARLGDLELRLPVAAPIIVGYHEAATVSAIGVTPVGRLSEDRNTTRTDLPADAAVGSPYLVLTSRGRSAGPTSAVDVVLEPDVPVLAPVTGRVADVRSYLLYGAHQDLRIELIPDGRPDLRLVLIHLDGAEVAIGDRVTAGITPIARTARRFTFSSHVDRETEPDRYPHVHMELQPVDAPRPGDPVDGDTDRAAEGDGTDGTGDAAGDRETARP